MNNARLVVAAGLVLALLACTSGTAQKQRTENARGAELLAPFKQDLKQALVAGMQEGPLTAISVCKDQAPAIAESLSTAGVQMGRTSHRLRNPDNSAPEWVDTVLQTYLGEEQGRAPRLVTLAERSAGLCRTNCHSAVMFGLPRKISGARCRGAYRGGVP